MPNRDPYRSAKASREAATARRRQQKIARRQKPQEGDIDYCSAPSLAPSPNAFPNAPEAFAGIARTFSRGL